jgi:hypothetical protein
MVAVYEWLSWHCGWGFMIWCPATRGGDYGLDAEGLVEHIAIPGLGIPLFVAAAIGIYNLMNRRPGNSN